MADRVVSQNVERGQRGRDQIRGRSLPAYHRAAPPWSRAVRSAGTGCRPRRSASIRSGRRPGPIGARRSVPAARRIRTRWGHLRFGAGSRGPAGVPLDPLMAAGWGPSLTACDRLASEPVKESDPGFPIPNSGEPKFLDHQHLHPFGIWNSLSGIDWFTTSPSVPVSFQHPALGRARPPLRPRREAGPRPTADRGRRGVDPIATRRSERQRRARAGRRPETSQEISPAEH
jgi:hypothetical protein